MEFEYWESDKREPEREQLVSADFDSTHLIPASLSPFPPPPSPLPPGPHRVPTLQLKKVDELESEVKKKPEQWNSDLASELKGHEEGKRASSPSPSEGASPLFFSFEFAQTGITCAVITTMH